MIGHVDEGMLQALLDDELPDGDERSTRVHLAACPTCRQRFEEVRESSHTLARALSLLDPAGNQPGVLAIQSAPSIRSRPSRWRGSGAARAAVMLLTFAAAASATVPGSPVRRWLIDAWESPRAVALRTEPVATTAPIAAGAIADETGVSVPMASDRFEVVLSEVDPTLQVRARLVDSPRGAVYAVGAATDSRFATAPGVIQVSGSGAGELRVEIPREAASATIVVDGRTYLVKEGDQLRLLPTDDAGSAEIIFRVRE